MPLKICVIGLGSNVPSGLAEIARRIGICLSKYSNFVLLTGSCHGTSYEVIKEVKKQKPSIKVIGFSPAKDKSEHLRKYRYPVDYFDKIKFIGGGKQQRSIQMISECDKVIMIGGQMGSLTEFCLAYRTGKHVAILEYPCSASDKKLISTIARFCYEDGCGSFFFKKQPKSLVRKLFS